MDLSLHCLNARTCDGGKHGNKNYYAKCIVTEVEAL